MGAHCLDAVYMSSSFVPCVTPLGATLIHAHLVGCTWATTRPSIQEKPSGSRRRTSCRTRSAQGARAGAQHREVQCAVRSVGWLALGACDRPVQATGVHTHVLHYMCVLHVSLLNAATYF